MKDIKIDIMSCKLFSRLTFIFLLSIFALNLLAQDNTLKGKLICGYQGWFNCYGDGSPVERWVHWSAGKYRSNEGWPDPGNLSFELYPDVTDYQQGSLFQTGFGDLSSGQPSVLFSSTKEDVIDTHFKWMQQYGIDGVALQRFLTTDGVFVKQKDTVALYMRDAAEKYQRIFYMTFDMKASDSVLFRQDLQHIESFDLTSSPYYAYQDGKPVICIWGFGFTGRPDLPEASLQLINWLKDKGYYVIGGVPTYWRTGTNDSWPDYKEVYDAFDMISPWAVGRFRDSDGANNYHANVTLPDKVYCKEKGIDYMPVVFPGFAWSNWNGGLKNDISRNKGEFLWKQVHNVLKDSLSNIYVAMFDEYDEATAIMKAADSYLSIPDDQYFLTTSADGTFISSDFYLRLVAKANRALKGIDELSPEVTIPHSAGPVYFRTSVEEGYDAMPDWSDKVFESENIGGPDGFSIPLCRVQKNNRHNTIGKYSITVDGEDNSEVESYAYFDVFEVDIPIYEDTRLVYWTQPLNENGRHIFLDLLMADGSRLKDIDTVMDIDGNPMITSGGRGEINSWNENIYAIGEWLEGKTIDRILVGYENDGDTGPLTALIDDIFIVTSQDTSYMGITRDKVYTGLSKEKYLAQPTVRIYPNPMTENHIIIDLAGIEPESERIITLCDITGKVHLEKKVDFRDSRYDLSTNFLTEGMYLLKITGGTGQVTTTIMVR